MPELSLAAQALFRSLYGLLLLAFLALSLPLGRRFFVSERGGGYLESAPMVNAVGHPRVYPILMLSWIGAATCLVLGAGTVWAALWNLLVCRTFFVMFRWRGVARGMGAPGLMAYWLAAAVFLLEFTLRYAPGARQFAVFALQVDWALIMLSAGVYKVAAGYPRNFGMELGLANPEWGYWWRLYQRMSPGHWVFRWLNHLAWLTEVVAAGLMLAPSTRLVGALLISASFLFIATQIRLGVLAEMVIIIAVLFVPAGTAADRWLATVLPDVLAAGPPGPDAPGLEWILKALLIAYLAVLPLAHGGLSLNFYARRILPGPLQRLLEGYTNFFGLLIWRVFSVDVINFFIRIYCQRGPDGPRELVSRWGYRGGLRYGHVCESIAVTSLFTTLKYYPSNGPLFTQRLLRYARTVPCPAGAVLIFEYVSLLKGPRAFEAVPVAAYIVDPRVGSVTEQILSNVVSVRAAHAVSPVHEGLRPGSYVPAGH